MKALGSDQASSTMHDAVPSACRAGLPTAAGAGSSRRRGRQLDDSGASGTTVEGHGQPEEGGKLPETPVDEAQDPQQLVVYSDAGFGGVGTRSQTGVLVMWAGSPVLARSSRQSVSALSTCEAEVCAACTAWVCTEGLMCLLEECT